MFEALYAKHPGRPRKFETPDDLWEAAVAYFEWAESNPVEDEELFAYQGDVTRETVDRPQAFTISGFCRHANVARNTFDEYAKREEYLGVISGIKEVMTTQKFTLAAANMLNANLISRDLGLADKRELGGPDGGPIKTDSVTRMVVEIVDPHNDP